ncbi:MAG: FG-GAP repeat domain-containing protein [Candidatus Woesearchaeota archaeon]
MVYDHEGTKYRKISINPFEPVKYGVTLGDFDGDGLIDPVFYQAKLLQPENWRIYFSSHEPTFLRLEGLRYGRGVYDWGHQGMLPAVGDFDGDGISDIAVFSPSESRWYVLFSNERFPYWPEHFQRSLSTFTFNDNTGYYYPFGKSAEDIPVPADYIGDGITNIATFTPQTGEWNILSPSEDVISIQFGMRGDVPVPADYTGDGRVDLAVYRPSNNMFYFASLAGTPIDPIPFGIPGDIPIPEDFTGDGRADLAVYRPSKNMFYIASFAGETREIPFGIPGDVPVTADFDGDGLSDIAVYRPSKNTLYVFGSSVGPLEFYAPEGSFIR